MPSAGQEIAALHKLRMRLTPFLIKRNGERNLAAIIDIFKKLCSCRAQGVDEFYSEMFTWSVTWKIKCWLTG